MYYAAVHFPARDVLGVTNNEYMMLYMIRQLQGGPGQNGWCSASASTLSYYLGIARRNIFVMLGKLERMGLLEVSPNGRLRRTTEVFESAYINREKIVEYDAKEAALLVTKHHHSKSTSDETSPVSGDESSPALVTNHHQQVGRFITFTGDESSPYNNSNKNIIKRSSSCRSEKTPTPPPTSKKIKFEIENSGQDVNYTVSSTATPPPPPQVAARPPAPAKPWQASAEYLAGPVFFGQALRGRGVLPENTDTDYYFNRGAEWSANSAARTGNTPLAADWVGKIHGWAVADMNAGKLHTIQQTQHTAYDGTTYTVQGNPAHTGSSPGRKQKYSNGRPDPAACIASARRVAERLAAEGYGT